MNKYSVNKPENDIRIVLFVKLKTGQSLTQALIDEIKSTIRQNASPRCVSAMVVAVDDIPYTINGKRVELTVRNVIHNLPVANKEVYMKLKDMVAIITGAATGIGRASAVTFAKEGARIVIADIKDKEAEETVKMVKATGSDGIFVHTDVTQLTQIENLVKIAVARFGKLDIFFHNAGIAGPGALEVTSEKDYDFVMAINLKAGYFGAKYAVPEIRKAGGGSILFTSSGLGLRPTAESPSYSMTKAGLVMLTRCLAVSLARDNIRVNAICPGPVDETPLWSSFISRVPGTDPGKYASVTMQGRPIQRFGTAQEMANGALFLVSPENSYITGVALPIDGGGAAR